MILLPDRRILLPRPRLPWRARPALVPRHRPDVPLYAMALGNQHTTAAGRLRLSPSGRRYLKYCCYVRAKKCADDSLGNFWLNACGVTLPYTFWDAVSGACYYFASGNPTSNTPSPGSLITPGTSLAGCGDLKCKYLQWRNICTGADTTYWAPPDAPAIGGRVLPSCKSITGVGQLYVDHTCNASYTLPGGATLQVADGAVGCVTCGPCSWTRFPQNPIVTVSGATFGVVDCTTGGVVTDPTTVGMSGTVNGSYTLSANCASGACFWTVVTTTLSGPCGKVDGVGTCNGPREMRDSRAVLTVDSTLGIYFKIEGNIYNTSTGALVSTALLYEHSQKPVTNCSVASMTQTPVFAQWYTNGSAVADFLQP